MIKELSEYPVVLEQSVAWGDMDALQHVNNTVYFKYFESARIAFLHAAGIAEMLMTQSIGPVISQTSCRYKAAVTFPDTLSVAARVKQLTMDTMVTEYAIYSHSQGRITTVGGADIVMFDFKNKCKAQMSDIVLDAIINLQNIDDPRKA
ncbi:acyl-CoA thioesterase [Alginatibacterium sediminis]|uniref:Acyl-CoA thioesterase n=1 Tax=Alginatibacterium sediminis TaxID=2164068 RepID=A0A420ECX9_9ALTE|nr:acyl-CoA thioesterase [Alginatibacterium sediminis]RKF18523.1 acyl-CoA thioesterase [Alginatibacterium sediminis]